MKKVFLFFVVVSCLSGCGFLDLLGGNTKPVANAGTDSSVAVGGIVRLDGSLSGDRDGDALSYRWSFTAVPEGSGAALDDATAVKPAFVPTTAGEYVVRLVVNDGKEDSAADFVTVTASSAASEEQVETPLFSPAGGSMTPPRRWPSRARPPRR